MFLVSVACLVALGLTLVAVYREQPQTVPDVAAPRAPLPDADQARVEFPVRPFGYAPAAVDTAYEALRLAYADLLAEAPPDVVERARRRAAQRAGIEEPPQEQPPQEQQGRDLPGREQAGKDRPGKDRPGRNQPGKGRPGPDQPPGEQPAQEKPASTITPAQWAGGGSPGAGQKPARRGRAQSKRVG